MPNLHIACDFVFDVTRSLLIMQWTRCEYARTTRTRRWNSHLVFLPSFSPLYISLSILTYLSLFYIYFLAIFSSAAEQRAEKKETVLHFEKIRAVFFLNFPFLSVFSSLFSFCVICSLISEIGFR